jgi:hypothetical protein
MGMWRFKIKNENEEKHLYILEPPKPRGCKFCIQPKKIWKKSGVKELFQWDAILDAEVTIILFSSVYFF